MRTIVIVALSSIAIVASVAGLGCSDSQSRQVANAKTVLAQKISKVESELSRINITLAGATANDGPTTPKSKRVMEWEAEQAQLQARLAALKKQLDYIEIWGKMPPESMLTE